MTELPRTDLALLSGHLHAVIGIIATATEQVPPHLRRNFVASIAATTLAKLALEGATTTLRQLRGEIDRLLAGGTQPSPHILSGPIVGPDTDGRAH